ncbi:hypothetical protein [Lactococcus petauri]|uniref:Uncharacterized protein n=1 Tax=Lactococcus phage WP-2 TaxID=1486423 RepID=A0A024B3S2_9CAUD|nr:hypothetical protein [Lactococcus petauri]YP_009032581.1 hypothetical protein WP2_04 [Lactococcus phage WP-2]AHZ10876.1 hypothetical protein WP2_04 [Lactococcus phage WP-2]MCQ8276821.1 hypothetical protein [Lactococcus petauri]MCR6590492.1 hypothetical protein [Lactococcus petauri]MCV5953898.1 hypothetical protein [Lactococcus petauri]
MYGANNFRYNFDDKSKPDQKKVERFERFARKYDPLVLDFSNFKLTEKGIDFIMKNREVIDFAQLTLENMDGGNKRGSFRAMAIETLRLTNKGNLANQISMLYKLKRTYEKMDMNAWAVMFDLGIVTGGSDEE